MDEAGLIEAKYRALEGRLDEATLRLWAAAEAMWRRATEHVLAQLAGGEPPPSSEVEVSLVVRGSTGPPAKGRGAR